MPTGKSLVEQEAKKKGKKWSDVVALAKKERSSENTIFLEEVIKIRSSKKKVMEFHNKFFPSSAPQGININSSMSKKVIEEAKNLKFWEDAVKRKVEMSKIGYKEAVSRYLKTLDKPEAAVAKLLNSDTVGRLK